MYKAVIIDDEEMARVLLNGMIETYCPSLQVVDMCHDLPCGVKSIRKHKPDLIFLDIEMPGHSGLELLDFFDESDIDFSIVFITAYHQYAIQAFKLSAVDYLLKPVDAEDLVQAISLFEKKRDYNKYQILKENITSIPKKIALNTSSSTLFVGLDHILFFKAEGAYTNVFLDDGRVILTSKNLKHYEDTLSYHEAFYRCHKSYMINIPFVSEYVKSEGGYLKIRQHSISISLDKIATVLAKIS